MSNRHRLPTGPTDMDRRLADLRRDQAEKRTKVHASTELDELRAVKHLAYELFGNRGCVEFGPSPWGTYEGGPIWISEFIDPPPPPGGPKIMRKTRPRFRGASIAELVEQVNLWKAKRA